MSKWWQTTYGVSRNYRRHLVRSSTEAPETARSRYDRLERPSGVSDAVQAGRPRPNLVGSPRCSCWVACARASSPRTQCPFLSGSDTAGFATCAQDVAVDCGRVVAECLNPEGRRCRHGSSLAFDTRRTAFGVTAAHGTGSSGVGSSCSRQRKVDADQ